MNCKQGDLAIIVGADDPENLSLIVMPVAYDLWRRAE